jgi:hypothetical protein
MRYTSYTCGPDYVYLNSKPVEPGLHTDVDRALGLV